MQHVYVIGGKGIPGSYGGYETFVDKLTEYHKNDKNIKYHVACKAKDNKEFEYNNCFYCGKKLENNVHVDHFIPWSFVMNDELWNEANAKGINYYTKEKVSKKMQKVLKNKNMDNIYVITTVGNNNEGEFKREYVNKYYKIKKENVIYVNDNSEKTACLINIRKKLIKGKRI